MSYKKRLDAAFQTAPTLPILPSSRFVFMSDCHRGIGNSNDNFLKNQHIYFAALNYYYKMGYTYIEIGDGDELWENPDITHIKEIYSNIHWLLSLFAQKKRLYLLWGNHDLEKKFYDSSDFSFYEGIILEDSISHKVLHLTHGHQAELLNSTFWRLARFLVR
ncbi:MAG: serine/threonine protein phosphatase, partial [Lachnospiraceae bacterium]|nr:serine/threonine protein phosphatase [Lachnospiraceae bacterium]